MTTDVGQIELDFEQTKTKICTKCGVEKNLDCYYKEGGGRVGVRSVCKECCVIQKAEYYNNNKDKIAEYYKNNKDKIAKQQAEYRKNNKDKIAKISVEYMKNNKDKIAKIKAEYKKNNKDKIVKQRAEYYNNNKDKIAEYYKNNKDKIAEKGAEYRNNNKDKIAKQQAEYRKNNKDKIAKRQAEYKKNNKDKIAEYEKERYKTNINFKLSKNLRRRIQRALKNNSKAASTTELIGCSREDLILHLEKQWKEGMSWDNYEKFGWHVDHIIPCASFDLTDPEQQKKCFHYTNLQPLWWRDNLSKSDKIPVNSDEIQKSLDVIQ